MSPIIFIIFYSNQSQSNEFSSRARRDDLPGAGSGRVSAGMRVKPGRELYRPPGGSWNIDGETAVVCPIVAHTVPQSISVP